MGSGAVIDRKAWIELGERLRACDPEKFLEVYGDLLELVAIRRRESELDDSAARRANSRIAKRLRVLPS